MLQWLTNLFRRNETRANKIPPQLVGDAALYKLFGFDRDDDAGVVVNESTAMTCSAVWAAVQRISTSIASLPVHLFGGRDEGKKVRITGDRVARLFSVAPNPETTPIVFFETCQNHVLLSGNSYSEIEYNQAGQPIALWPLVPSRVEPIREEKTKALLYRVKYHDAAGVERKIDLPAWKVLHVPGLGYDGVRGFSVVEMARRSIGLTIAAEKYGATFFKNHATPGGVLQSPGPLDEPAYDRMKKSWLEEFEGVDKAFRLAILEEGTTYTRISGTPEEAQFLGSRQFQLSEIARWFNIPPHMIGDLSRATFSNIEHLSAEFVMYTLRPWLIRWEQELTRKLIADRSSRYLQFNADALLRGDLTTRYQAYATGRMNGWLTLNEIRRREDLPTVDEPHADEYWQPLNIGIAGEPTPEPSPPIEPEPSQPDEDDSNDEK